MVDQVDRIDCSIDTTDLARSHMLLSYIIKNSQTGAAPRPARSRVGNELGRWWFVDEGRCCEALCLCPGGDRFRYPEAHGVTSSSQDNAPAKPVQRQPRGVTVAKRGRKKSPLRLAKCRVRKAASRCMALYKYGRWRTAIPSLTRTLIGHFAWIGATLLAFWKRAGMRKIVAPPLRL
jgi:hypothetical protein